MYPVLREEIVNTMRNIGASTINDLKPEMVDPLGPWVGANRPVYVPRAGTLKLYGRREAYRAGARVGRPC